jgi:hypothetical protein
VKNLKRNFFAFYLIFSEDWFPEGKQNIQAGHLKEALVASLNPWTVYHLRLFAENQLGKSKEGKVLQVNSIKNYRRGAGFTNTLSTSLQAARAGK